MILHDKLPVPYEKIRWKDKALVRCDYCGEEVEKNKCKIQKGRKLIEKDCCSKKECTRKKFEDISIFKYGVSNPSKVKEIREKAKKTNLERYGVEHPQQNAEIRKKSRATCLKNHGVEHALQNNSILKKAKSTSLERYGSEFPIQLEEFKSKVRKTNLEKFGREDFLSSDEVKERIKKTNLKKYGFEHAASSPKVREKMKSTCMNRYGAENCFSSESVRKKIKKTMLAKYGVSHPSHFHEINEKKRKTNIERYGHENPAKNPEVRKKTVETNLARYGVECNLSTPETKDKIKKTNLERYGVDCTLKNPEVKEKIKKTNLEKYGCEHTFSSSKIRDKSIKTKIERYGKPYPVWKYGKTQDTISSWLNSLGFDFKPDVAILEGKEIDLYDSNQKLALEFCGLYWHNENSPQPRTRSYHHDKWRRCRDKGIQLLTIFDDEWRHRNEVCKSLILSKLGIFERRLQGRKCEVREIPKAEMKSFCDLNHLQGANKLSRVCFGLFHEEEMVGAVDLGNHHRRKDKGTLVLTRLCFKPGVNVVGGSGKLFKACVDWCAANGINRIVSWSDNRYSDGGVYEKMGFIRAGELPPDYYYVDMVNPKRRISKQSQSKKKADCPPGMTELQWANSRGLSRIWDCGKVRWEYEVHTKA